MIIYQGSVIFSHNHLWQYLISFGGGELTGMEISAVLSLLSVTEILSRPPLLFRARTALRISNVIFPQNILHNGSLEKFLNVSTRGLGIFFNATILFSIRRSS